MAIRDLDVLGGNREVAKSLVVKDYFQPNQKRQGPIITNLLQLYHQSS